mmetsp:Transcript_26259/g.37315  ORF Transcript_26259/g.37315 Transcript_26259/m.37315 type:complete len:435 (+) Transcript_26259:2-1306(+)
MASENLPVRFPRNKEELKTALVQLKEHILGCRRVDGAAKMGLSGARNYSHFKGQIALPAFIDWYCKEFKMFQGSNKVSPTTTLLAEVAPTKEEIADEIYDEFSEIMEKTMGNSASNLNGTIVRDLSIVPMPFYMKDISPFGISILECLELVRIHKSHKLAGYEEFFLQNDEDSDGGDNDKERVDDNDKERVDDEEIFLVRCNSCHGVGPGGKTLDQSSLCKVNMDNAAKLCCFMMSFVASHLDNCSCSKASLKAKAKALQVIPGSDEFAMTVRSLNDCCHHTIDWIQEKFRVKKTSNDQKLLIDQDIWVGLTPRQLRTEIEAKDELAFSNLSAKSNRYGNDGPSSKVLEYEGFPRYGLLGGTIEPYTKGKSPRVRKYASVDVNLDSDDEDNESEIETIDYNHQKKKKKRKKRKIVEGLEWLVPIHTLTKRIQQQ